MSPRSRRRVSVSAVRSLRDSVSAVADPAGPSVTARLASLPRMVKAVAAKDYTGASPARVGLMVAAAAYIASPVDLIPEKFAPILGLADDAVVLAWLAGALVQETDQFLQWEALPKRTVRGRRVR